MKIFIFTLSFPFFIKCVFFLQLWYLYFFYLTLIQYHMFRTLSESECCSVTSNSLWLHGLYSSWNSSGQNTGVGSLSLFQGIFPNRDRAQVAIIVGGFFTSWATREALDNTEGNALGKVKGFDLEHQIPKWQGEVLLSCWEAIFWDVLCGYHFLG